MAERTMQYMRLSEIAPATRNAKRHDQAHIDASMDEFGYIEAVVLDERTGQLIAGHGRCENLATRRARGQAPPEDITTDPEGEWLVPVQRGWSSRDDRQAEAAGIALNRATEKGGWDERLLHEMLGDLMIESAVPPAVGFSDDEFAAMTAKLADPVPPPAFPNAEALAGNTQHRCPKCGYEWSGSPTPGAT